MGVQFNEVNFSKLFNTMRRCCLSEEACGTCSNESCLIGYGEESIRGCMINKRTYVQGGFENLPLSDTKIYDTDELITGIVEILKTCKSCSEEHYEDCIVNVLRGCYEVSLLGEEQNYPGSTFIYFNNIKKVNPKMAERLFDAYHAKEDK